MGSFTCVTGVSGSGKSTLILQTLYNALNLTLNNNKSRKVPKPFKGFKGIELVDKVINIDYYIIFLWILELLALGNLDFQ